MGGDLASGPTDRQKGRSNGKEVEEEAGPSTVTVESGAFTISSTIVGEDSRVSQNELSFLGSLGASGTSQESSKQLTVPSPRFNAGMTFKGGSLYLFGGLWECGE